MNSEYFIYLYRLDTKEFNFNKKSNKQLQYTCNNVVTLCKYETQNICFYNNYLSYTVYRRK